MFKLYINYTIYKYSFSALIEPFYSLLYFNYSIACFQPDPYKILLKTGWIRAQNEDPPIEHLVTINKKFWIICYGREYTSIFSLWSRKLKYLINKKWRNSHVLINLVTS